MEIFDAFTRISAITNFSGFFYKLSNDGHIELKNEVIQKLSIEFKKIKR
jgi:hypothetical protein